MVATDRHAPEVSPWLAHYPDYLDWHAEIPVRPLHAIVDDARDRFATRPCLDFLGKRWTYAETCDAIDRAARGLQAMGLRKGDRVGLFLPNCPYFVIAYFATLKAGGIVVNFNPLYAPLEVEKQVEDSGVSIMVTLDLAMLFDKVSPSVGKANLRTVVVGPMAEILPTAKAAAFRVLKRRERAAVPRDPAFVPFAALLDKGDKPEPVEIDPERDLAVIQYTGGTTGVPKGACLTHRNLYANPYQMVLWYPKGRPGQERILGVLPFFHVFAMTTVMNYGLMVGAELIMMPRFELTALLKTVQRKRPTLMPGVPTLYAAIANSPLADRYDLSSLDLCISGGAPLPAEIRRAFQKRTGCMLVEGYGLSETSPIATCNPLLSSGKDGSIGIPVPGTEIIILSLDEPRRPMPTGEVGEICIGGPQVMRGYWNRPQDTANSLAGGRMHTGDVGYMDEDGYVFIVDRLKEVILAAGFNVYPRVVEEQIYEHPAVAEVAVIGVADSYRGQTVKAYVVLKPGESVDGPALEAFLTDRLSPIEIPKQWAFREALPKSAVGKILKKELVAESAEAGS